jgi:hypothetical protein
MRGYSFVGGMHTTSSRPLCTRRAHPQLNLYFSKFLSSFLASSIYIATASRIAVHSQPSPVRGGEPFQALLESHRRGPSLTLSDEIFSTAVLYSRVYSSIIGSRGVGGARRQPEIARGRTIDLQCQFSSLARHQSCMHRDRIDTVLRAVYVVVVVVQGSGAIYY